MTKKIISKRRFIYGSVLYVLEQNPRVGAPLQPRPCCPGVPCVPGPRAQPGTASRDRPGFPVVTRPPSRHDVDILLRSFPHTALGSKQARVFKAAGPELLGDPEAQGAVSAVTVLLPPRVTECQETGMVRPKAHDGVTGAVPRGPFCGPAAHPMPRGSRGLGGGRDWRGRCAREPWVVRPASSPQPEGRRWARGSGDVDTLAVEALAL